MLQRIFGAKLPSQVTPFILGDMLVRETGGLVRPMRRRRLRWDNEHQSIPVRGKRGWIGYVVSEARMPVTVDELGDLLRKYYQDYAAYVLEQIDLDMDEDGSHHCSAVLLPGVPHRVPTILVPADWQYDPQAENVSDEVKLLVAKIAVFVRNDELRQEDLAYAPWLVELVTRRAYGENIWENKAGLRACGTPALTANVADTRPSGNNLLAPPAGTQPRLTSGSEVDDLLAKFL
jgi:hypothetical protein